MECDLNRNAKGSSAIDRVQGRLWTVLAALALALAGCGSSGGNGGSPGSPADSASVRIAPSSDSFVSAAVMEPDAASTPSPAAAPKAPSVSAPSVKAPSSFAGSRDAPASAGPAKQPSGPSKTAATARPPSPSPVRSAGASAGFAAGAASPASAAGQPAAERAELLYRQNCVACHGAELQGGVGPNLQRVGGRLSRDAIARQIAQGGDGMLAFGGRLSEADIRALADWLAAHK